MTRRNRVVRYVRVSILLVLAAYLLGMWLYIPARLLTGDRYWPLSFANTFALYGFLPLLVAVPLALLLRARWLTLIGVVALVVGLLHFGPLYLPKQTPTAQGVVIKVMTFNIWYENNQTDVIEKYIVSINPDLVLIQEITNQYANEGIKALQTAYPYQVHESFRTGDLILSKFPIVEQGDFALGRDMAFDHQRVVIDVSGQKIAVYNIHLPYPLLGTSRIHTRFWYLNAASGWNDKPRNQQAAELLDKLDGEQLRYIVGGDFNSSSQSATYDMLAAVMRDSWREAGWGLGATWPNARVAGLPSFMPPVIKIDYLWHSYGIATLEAHVGPPLTSDHLPYMATFDILPNGGASD